MQEINSCPKCGSSEIELKFIYGGGSGSIGKDSKMTYSQTKEEAIEIKCKKCKYVGETKPVGIKRNSACIYSDEELKIAYSMDAKMIAMSFKLGEKLGTMAIKASVNDFTELLTNQKGKFVPSMDLDYRRYIVGLLDATINTVDEAHKEHVFREIVLPSN
jgi:predicted nucleic-acid-binding Zn-ribbon protein